MQELTVDYTPTCQGDTRVWLAGIKKNTREGWGVWDHREH